MRARFTSILLATLWLAPAARPAADTPGLRWHRDTLRLDANVPSWTLQKTLEDLAGRTGWHVYWDTNAQLTISSRFNNLPLQDALPRLVGDLSFSFRNRTNAPSELFVFRGSIAQATERIQPAASPDSPDQVGNELILRLRPGSKADLDALVAKYGAKVVGRIDDLNAVRLRFDSDEAAQKARTELAGNEEVASVESNFNISPPSHIQAAQGGLPPLNIKPSGANAAGQIVVALLDTSVSPSNPTLKDFLLQPVSVSSSAQPSAEASTHGPAMAETILRAIASQYQGGESNVRILPVDVYGGQTTTTTFDLVRGLYEAAKWQPSVINMSLAGEGESALLHDAIKAYADKGVLIFAAPGNEPTKTIMLPAAHPEVTAVTASDSTGRLAPYANRGDFVDLMAPGTSVVQVNGQTLIVSGTSTATANISGIAAALLDRKNATSADVLAALKKAFPFTPTGSSPAAATAPAGVPGTR